MKVIHLFLLALILPLTVIGQSYTSRFGWFKVQEKKGCAPFNVVITSTGDPFQSVPTCSGSDPCLMEWGDGTTNSSNGFSHIYTTPGTYLLKVLFKQPFGYDDIEITVTPNVKPAFDIYTCGGQKVQLKVPDTNYDAYIINYGDGSSEIQVPKGSLAKDEHDYFLTLPQPQPDPSPQTISVRGKNTNAADNCTPPATKTVDLVTALKAPIVDLLTVTNSDQVDFEFGNASYSDNVIYKLEIATNTNAGGSFQLTSSAFLNVTSGGITGLRTDDNYYCFRLGAFDPCVNSLARSNIICSADFDVSAQSNVNNLAWTTSTTGVSNFTIERDITLLGTTGALSYADNDVICNQPYVYQLFTNYANGSQSISLAKSVTAFSSDIPTAIENVTAVVGDNTVDLTWLQDPAFAVASYSVFRKAGDGNYNLLASTPSAQLSDGEYSTDGIYCYQINYTDECGNISTEGIDVCPIRLSGKVNADNSMDLTWSEYTGWKNGVDHYLIEKYDSEGTLIQIFNNGTSTTFPENTSDPDNQIYRFIVKAVANDAGLSEAVSNELTLIKEPNIFYPKAFTPNSDKLNDTWVVFGQFVTGFEMKIFNRWGELLFTSSNLDEGWDGKYKGTNQPEGTYAFIAKITDRAGRTFDRSGSFVLLNKK